MSADLLASPGRRRWLFALLYLCEGAPIGYLWWAIPAKLRAGGVPVEDIAAFGAALTLPWGVKFLWAPLVDAGRSRRFGLRPWIVGPQLLMAATLLPLAATPDLAASYRALYPVLIAHAVCAATQDVAIDALAVRRIPLAERGRATAWMQLGMLGGRAVFGGAALALEGVLGAPAVVGLLVAALAAGSGVALMARDTAPGLEARALAARVALFARRLAAVLRHEATWLGLAFATLVGAGMEATGALAGPLLVDRGFSQEEVGGFFAGPTVVAMAVGVFVGGQLADRVRRARAVVVSVAVLAAVVVAVAATASLAVDGPRWPLVVALALAYVPFGAVTSASYALLMDLTDPELGGTQFSAYMGAVNLCYVWSAWSAGQLAARFDYGPAFLAMAAVSVGALALLPALSRRALGVHQVRDGRDPTAC